MRYLAIVLSVLMLAGCGSSELRKSWYANCRLQGYEQGTQAFNDCVTVARNESIMRAYAAQRAAVGRSMQTIGNGLIQQGMPSYAPAPAVAPTTKFCYPGPGYTYCQ